MGAGGGVTTDKWDRILWPRDCLGSHPMAEIYSFYCFFPSWRKFPTVGAYSPYFLNPKDQREKFHHCKFFPINSSPWLFLMFFSVSPHTTHLHLEKVPPKFVEGLRTSHTVPYVWSPLIAVFPLVDVSLTVTLAKQKSHKFVACKPHMQTQQTF